MPHRQRIQVGPQVLKRNTTEPIRMRRYIGDSKVHRRFQCDSVILTHNCFKLQLLHFSGLSHETISGLFLQTVPGLFLRVFFTRFSPRSYCPDFLSVLPDKNRLQFPLALAYNSICLLSQDLYRWRRIEAVITSSTRNRVVG